MIVVERKIQAKYHLIVENKSILNFYLVSVKEGFVFGIELPKRNIHLTILINQEKKLLQPHITDTERESHHQPWGQYTDLTLINEEIMRRVKS